MHRFAWFRRRRLALIGFLLTLLVSFVVPKAALSVDTSRTIVNLGVFSNALPYLVARDEGFFNKQNLDVNFLRVNSSTQQFDSLRSGQYDMINTNLDNVLNYRLNQRSLPNGTFPVQIIAGTQLGGNLTVVGQKGTNSLAEFRGKTVAVDSPTSGFAYVIYQFLRNAGLERGVDYRVAACGGGDRRLQALRDGTCVVNGQTFTIDGGALLSGPTLLSAQAEGFPTLASILDVPALNPYLGGALVATEPWLEANRDVAIRMVAALYEATEWALDPANRERAIEILFNNQPSTGLEGATQQYEVDTTPGIGLIPGVEIDRDALRTVVKLRKDFNGFDEAQNVNFLISPASDLFDRSYIREAERLLREQS